MDLIKERCGIICKNNFHEIKNVSKSYYEFEFDLVDFYRILQNYCKYSIEVIVHTHLEKCEPSSKDINSMKIWQIPWIIVSKSCIKAFVYLNESIFEINIHSLLSKELYNSLMKLLH